MSVSTPRPCRPVNMRRTPKSEECRIIPGIGPLDLNQVQDGKLLSRGPVLNQFEDSGGHVVCHCSTSKKARRDQLPNNCPFSSDPDPYTGDRLKSKSATIVVFLVPNYASYYQVMLPFASAEEPFTKTGTLRVLFIFE